MPSTSGRASWGTRLATESGLSAVLSSCRDTKILLLQRLVRLYAYGATFIILAHFLSTLGVSDSRIGLFMTLTLLGDVPISLVLTTITDQVGRRLILALGSGLMILSGLVFAVTSNYWFLVLASVLGVISPSGNEIGPFKAVEESVLAQLTAEDKRSDIFAWYTLFGTAGAALGTVTSGWMVEALGRRDGMSQLSAYRVVFLLYAAMGLAKLLLVSLLSPEVESEPLRTEYEPLDSEQEDGLLLADTTRNEPERPSTPKETHRGNTLLPNVRSILPDISPTSRSILLRLLLLFALDSFASGLASPSWLTYFFLTVHAVPHSTLGTLFLATNLLASLGNVLALPLARRFGPLRTMVFTHLPSALLLAAVPLPRSTAAAMALLALRASTQSMDQAPRQAFLVAAVLPRERTAVLGVVNVGKTLSQAGGVGAAGVLAGKGLWVVVLGGAGLLKATYDLLLLGMFLGLKNREDSKPRIDSVEEE